MSQKPKRKSKQKNKAQQMPLLLLASMLIIVFLIAAGIIAFLRFENILQEQLIEQTYEAIRYENMTRQVQIDASGTAFIENQAATAEVYRRATSIVQTATAEAIITQSP